MLFFVVLTSLYLFPVHSFEVTVLEDVLAPIGGKAELVCSVSGLKNRLRDCMWVAPDKKEFKTGTQKFALSSVSVDADSRRNECTLTINPVTKPLSGFWECVVTEDRETVGRFVYLRTYLADGKAPFQLLLERDEKRVTAQKGDSVLLKCPSNTRARWRGDRPACRWLSPAGQTFTLVGYYGEIHDYAEMGVELGGDIDSGECAIRIRSIDLLHSGVWTCSLLRTSQVEYGSEAVSAEIEVDIFRSARLDTEPRLQGFQRGDRDVRITLDVEIGLNEKFTDLYWILQRQFIVYEGETSCPVSKNNCYTSTKRRRKSATTFELELIIDTLSEEDIETPIVLVKDFRDRNGEDTIDIFYVPKMSDKIVADYDDKNSDRNGGTTKTANPTRRSRVKTRPDDECKIGDETVKVGDYLDFSDLCVRLECVDNGVVEPKSISQDDCRPKRRGRQFAKLVLPQKIRRSLSKINRRSVVVLGSTL